MGTIAKVIESQPNYEFVQVGGVVHYSDEFRVYLMGLPSVERHRIIRDLEEHHRPRKVINYKTPRLTHDR